MFQEAIVNNAYVPDTKPAQWKPVLAFVVHSDGSQSLVSQHEMDDSGALKQGVLASPYQLAQAANQCIQSEGRGDAVQKPQIQPENVLYESADTLVWYVPAQVRSMWFRIGKKRVERLMVPWPSLLFKAKKDDPALQVFALRYKRRPQSDDPLYFPPLMNIYRDGRVCQGTAKLPEERSVKTLSEMESSIFDTYFTHLNHSEVIKGINGTDEAFRYWEELSKERKKRFPVKDLIPMMNTHFYGEEIQTVGHFFASI